MRVLPCISVLIFVSLLIIVSADASAQCTDSDSTAGSQIESYYARGTAKTAQQSSTDVCNGKVLTEYYCSGSEILSKTYTCPDDCIDGACRVYNSYPCSDTDGTDTYKKGTATKGSVTLTEFCSTGTGNMGPSVYETRCIGGTMRYVETSCGTGCEDGACLLNPDCTDSDITEEYSSGKNYYVKGTVTGPNAYWDIVTYVDTCSDTTQASDSSYEGKYVREVFCTAGPLSWLWYTCPNGCRDGACIFDTECMDSDGGKDYYVKGYCTWNRDVSQHTDSCSYDMDAGVYILHETYCDSEGDIKTEAYECPGRCEDGACIEEVCTDTDGGKDYYLKGTTSSAKFGPSDAPKEWTDLCLRDYEKYIQGEYVPSSGFTEANALLEGSCGPDLNEPGVITLYECPHGCEDGACVQATGEARMSNARYKLPTAPADDIFSVDVTNLMNLDLDLNDYALIFTGNGYSIIIDGVQYLMRNEFYLGQETYILHPNESASISVTGGASAPLFAEETHCENEISVGLIEKGENSSDGIIALDSMNLECYEAYCNETDGGKDYYVKGISTGTLAHTTEITTVEDKCLSSTTLQEYYCYGGTLTVEIYTCPYGCEEGACKEPNVIGFTTLGEPTYFDLNAWGEFSITLKNRLANNITIYRLTIGMGSEQAHYFPNYTLVIGAGSAHYFSKEETGLNLGSQEEGSEYSVDVSILYTSGGFNHTETGTVMGVVSASPPMCEDGDTRPCGQCGEGVRTCYDGQWGACIGDRIPSEEVCDGIDNDCDGETDEGDVCQGGYCGDGICEFEKLELCEGESKNFTIYDEWYYAKLLGVIDESTAVITVNGVSKEVHEGSTYSISGADIYLQDIWMNDIAVKAAVGPNPVFYISTNTTTPGINGGIDLSPGGFFSHGDSPWDVSGPVVINEEHLPSILANGSFEDDVGNVHYYLQKILIGRRPIIYDSFRMRPVWDIGTDASEPLYKMEVDFSGGLNVSDTDVQGNQIELFGDTYVIGHGSTHNSLILYGSSVTQTISEGETATINIGGIDYTVSVIGVSSDTIAVISINGVSKEVREGSSYTINGLTVYTDKVYFFSRPEQTSQVRLMVGSSRITLTSGSEVEVGESGDTIENTYVRITGDLNTGISVLSIAVAAQDDDDDYIDDDTPFRDPVFGSFEFIIADFSDYDEWEDRCGNSPAGRGVRMVAGETSMSCEEDCEPTTECLPGQARQCGQTNVGRCQFGVQTCIDYMWSECIGEVRPIPEICENGVDDDCDGETDEDCYGNMLSANVWLDRKVVSQGDSLIASVIVSDSYGNRINASTVTFLVTPGNMTYTGLTNENGIWTQILRIGNIAPGEYTIKAVAEFAGYEPGSDDETFIVTASIVPVSLGDDITFISVAAIAVKMERIRLSMGEIQELVEGIIAYYNGINDTEKAALWQDISDDIDGVMSDIDELNGMIRDFLDEASNTKLARIKVKAREISSSVRLIVSKIVEAVG